MSKNKSAESYFCRYFLDLSMGGKYYYFFTKFFVNSVYKEQLVMQMK